MNYVYLIVCCETGDVTGTNDWETAKLYSNGDYYRVIDTAKYEIVEGNDDLTIYQRWQVKPAVDHLDWSEE